jgi:3-deoxy-D-manno-octulosonate 8-phosphate phosphatase (KDO 8-P phosphatase)
MHPEQIFAEKGGRFVTPFSVLNDKFKSTRALVFDWDGVFNNGHKGGGSASGFSEIDSMGANLLRFGIWLRNGKVPYTALLTGAENPIAYELSAREHFKSVYFKVPHKHKALSHMMEQEQLSAHEIAFFYDDVLDLPVAKDVGLRMLINDPAKVWFNTQITNDTADYVTANTAGGGAVREACELLLAGAGLYEQVIKERIQFSALYQQYLQERNQSLSTFYTLDKALNITISHHQ